MLDMHLSLFNANVKYIKQFRNGAIKWKDIPPGEYTVFAIANYGNQEFYWVKHLIVTRGRTILEFTNDGTCYIDTNKTMRK